MVSRIIKRQKHTSLNWSFLQRNGGRAFSETLGQRWHFKPFVVPEDALEEAVIERRLGFEVGELCEFVFKVRGGDLFADPIV